ncbi:MAG: TetR/AcrR family transcriptional regulator [Spirochaetes bacterium]|nr:TetR/AcrR family transcriptional regulator [Spirochaetota bacterium]
MPPKPKFTKEEIIQTAVQIAAKKGLSAITARELADKLCVSSRPIYSYFESIDELKKEVVKNILIIFTTELYKKRPDANQFLSVGLNLISFVKNNKEYYNIIKHEGAKFIDEKEVNSFADMIVDKVSKTEEYSKFSKTKIKDAYLKMAIFSHGLADFVYYGHIDGSEDFIRRMLEETGKAIMKYV